MGLNSFTTDIACGQFQGARKSQQDAVGAFSDPITNVSIIGLSDGIGGAGFGHLASRLILRTALESLKAQVGEIAAAPDHSPEILRKAAFAANRKLARYVADNPDKKGMGGTLVLCAIVAKKIYWLSVGDSLIYRFGKGGLTRLSADHSLATGIDNLASLGQIDPRIAKKMASRNTLTSALLGEELKKIDCPAQGAVLSKGDIIVVASDGIQTLAESEISDFILNSKTQGVAGQVSSLIQEVESMDAFGQDNLAICIAAIEAH
jgi:serine/threonine protein phosphatase PrpC